MSRLRDLGGFGFLPFAMMVLVVVGACTPRHGGDITAENLPASQSRAANVPVDDGARSPPRLYIDVSSSMTYFGIPKVKDGYTSLPFPEVVGALLSMKTVLGVDPELFGFGNRIGTVLPADVRSLAQNGARICAEACGNTESHIEKVFEEINADKPAVAFVVTDLWFANPGQIVRPSVAMAQPLRTVLARGDVIALMAVDAPYIGPIFDMPGGASPTYQGQYKMRPLFILAVGKGDKVKAAIAELRRTAFDVQKGGGELHVTIYDPSVFALPASGPAEFKFDDMSGIVSQNDFLISDQYITDIPQFAISAKAAEDARLNGGGAAASRIEGKIDLAGGLEDGTMWGGVFEARWSVHTNFRNREKEGADFLLRESWEKQDVQLSGAAPTTSEKDGSLGFAFDMAGAEVVQLANRASHLMSYEIVLKSLNDGAGADGAASWIKKRSFTVEEAAGLRVNHPDVFPTLGAGEFANQIALELSKIVAGRTVASGSFFFEVVR